MFFNSLPLLSFPLPSLNLAWWTRSSEFVLKHFKLPFRGFNPVTSPLNYGPAGKISKRSCNIRLGRSKLDLIARVPVTKDYRKTLPGCFERTGNDQTVSLSSHGREARRCVGTPLWFVLWPNHVWIEPLVRQVRQQRLSLLARTGNANVFEPSQLLPRNQAPSVRQL